jgi:four helix bundle protein
MFSKHYDLEERTYFFAKNVRIYLYQIPKNIISAEDIKQVTRSSGSVAANYIEANDSLSKKDFFLRIRICRKEAKESILWLKLLQINYENDIKLEEKRNTLIQEATELMMIFGSIIAKSKKM